MAKKNRISIPSKDSIKRELEKRRLEEDLYNYLLWLFEKVKKEEFLSNWHHRKICDALMKVFRGEITFLIINLPPRYTKTEIVIKAFVSWCLAKNPKSKFIHLSYSEDLALDNSSAIREIVTSDEYQYFWPTELKKDSDAKKKWFNKHGGGVYATATGGQITGFGAGKVEDEDAPNYRFEFSGAILIDDPLKPDDALSDTLRTKPNERFNNTIKSRRNSKRVPIILIMQRLHEEDLAGFLLDGGSEYEFYHLNLPAINEDGPSEFDPREVGQALWPAKHNEEDLEAMRLADAEGYAGQYQQRPAPEEGNIFKTPYFQFYTEVPEHLTYKCHSWDLTFKEKAKNAKKTKKKTDFVVGQEWAKNIDGDFYLLPHMLRDRMGFDRTLTAVKSFIKDHPDYKALLIEDKANGPAIIDRLRKEKVKRIIEVEPNASKIERAQSQVPLFKGKSIWFPDPSIAPWVRDFINELKVFPNGKNDDQVDAMTQALQHLESIGSHRIPKDVASGDKNRTFHNDFMKKDKVRKSRIKPKEY